jgi:hypothetical protein
MYVYVCLYVCAAAAESPSLLPSYIHVYLAVPPRKKRDNPTKHKVGGRRYMSDVPPIIIIRVHANKTPELWHGAPNQPQR